MAGSRPDQTEGEARLRQPWLTVARVGAFVVIATALVAWVWGIPIRYIQLATVCTAQPCGDQQPMPETLVKFRDIGVSLGFYSAYTGTVEVAFTLAFLVIAFLILWRKSDTWMGILTAVLLVTFGVSQTNLDALASSVPAWSLPVLALSLLSYICLGYFLYLFPNGRFAPRWTRFVAVGWFIFLPLGVTLLPPTLFVALLFSFLVISLAAQVYRYRRVSSPVQRQQTKWVVFSITIGIVGTVTIIALSNLLRISQATGMLGFFVGNTAIYAFSALIPISIGIAILRSRLWDIDVIINKALTYGLLTALLAAVYAGLVLGFERLAEAFHSGWAAQQPILVVLSTLTIAALFQPLRARIQRVVDRRFFRHKYDARRTVDAFSATLSNEVDLNQLHDHLLRVVDETMHPAHSSFWLRRAEAK